MVPENHRDDGQTGQDQVENEDRGERVVYTGIHEENVGKEASVGLKRRNHGKAMSTKALQFLQFRIS